MKLMRDISTVMRRMRVFGERRLAQHDLGFAEQLVIMYLAMKGESNQEAVARHFSLDKGSIAKTVAKLEARGLLVRKVSESDRRAKTLSLTPEAFALIDEMGAVSAELHEGMYAGLGAEEVAQFEATLAKIAENIVGMTERG